MNDINYQIKMMPRLVLHNLADMSPISSTRKAVALPCLARVSSVSAILNLCSQAASLLATCSSFSLRDVTRP